MRFIPCFPVSKLRKDMRFIGNLKGTCDAMRWLIYVCSELWNLGVSHFESNVGFIGQFLQKLIVFLSSSILLILFFFLSSGSLDFLSILSIFLFLLSNCGIVLLLSLSQLNSLSFFSIRDFFFELMLLLLLGNQLAEDASLAIVLSDSGSHGFLGVHEDGSDQKRYNK